MSEILQGLKLPPPPPPAEPVPAAGVILWRGGAEERELFWVRRGAPLRFAGDFHAFPGGKVDAEDARVAVRGASGEGAAAVAAAARELFEETGVLLADGAERLSSDERDQARAALLAGTLDFPAFLYRRALRLEADPFLLAGRWVTPPAFPIRFDARFFAVRMPPGEVARVWPGELSSGEWISTASALRRWEAGEVLLHPPTLWPIRCLHRAAIPGCLDAMRSPPQTEGFVTRRLEFQKGVFLTPLRTPTLPPAYHTCCYLVDLGGGLAVVDPGSPFPEEQAALERLLDELAAEGLPPREIWLTHAHADHLGGVARLRGRHRLPLHLHPDAAARLHPDPAGPVVHLGDGDLLGGRWRALHTPGHAAGHLCFHDERSGALLAGDMVSSLSTIVIDPPEGDMARYLASLARLRSLRPRTIYPAHGVPVPDGPGKIEEYIAHRHEREGKVVAALAGGGTLEEITSLAYQDTPPAMLPVAARSCLASLQKLEAEGRARAVEGRWRLP